MAFRPVGPHVQVGQKSVQGQEKSHPQQEPSRRGEPPGHALGLRLLHGGDQQAPHRGRHHHSGGKAQKDPLDPRCHLFAKEKYHAGAQHRHQAGKARSRCRPYHRLHMHASSRSDFLRF